LKYSRYSRTTYPIDALDSLVMASGKRNILDDCKRQLVEVLAVRLLHVLGSRFTADSGPDIVTALEEGIENMGGNITRSSGDQNSLAFSRHGS
jgi:hypothetical protein